MIYPLHLDLRAVPDIQLANTDKLYLAWGETINNLHGYLSGNKQIDIVEYIKTGEPIHRETAERFANIIAKTSMNNQLQEAYIVDAWRFAGFKTYRMLNEIKAVAYKNGKLLSPDKILKRSENIYKRYNKYYLRAEIQQANNAALAAERWHSFDNTGRYYLQYRTAKDERVRASHKILHGITLAKNDPFWQEFYPPNGWGCRCEVVEVLKSRYKKTPVDIDKLKKEIFKSKNEKPFAFNPGQQLKLFPPTASYYKVDNTGLIEKGILKNHRSYILREAKNLLNGKSVKIKELQSEIIFTNTGIREALNQPHENYIYKNQAILNLEKRIKTGEYIGFAEDDKNRFKGFHYIETKILNDKAWIVLKENFDGVISFYTIVDFLKKKKI